MENAEPMFEVLREGRVQPLSASMRAAHLEDEIHSALRVLAEHMHVHVYPTTAHRDATPRYLIVPHHEMKDHVLLMVDGSTTKLEKAHQNRDPSPMDSWLHFLSIMPDLPARLSERASELSEERIQSLLDVMIDVDPFEPVEAKIDARNAELRAEFLKDFPVLDSATVHKRAGLKGKNTSQTANAWRQRGRILGLPIQGKIGYPAFQFNADGQPLKLMEAILAVLPAHFTAWQRAFWLVSPKEGLDGETPAGAMQAGDDRVVDVAELADQLPAG